MINEIIDNKRILFVTTKNIDYIRNSQELKIIKTHSRKYIAIYSKQKNQFFRIIEVHWKLFWFMVRYYRVLMAIDIVFLGFSPQLILPIWGKAFKNNYVITDFFVSVYDTLVCDRKIFGPGYFMSRFCHKIDEITVKRSDYLIADTKTHAEYFISEFGAEPDKIEVLYLEADKSIYNQKRKAIYKNDGNYTILYFGSILPLQGIDTILDAIRILKGEDKIRFDIIGPIPESIKKPLQHNVTYTDWLSQEKLADRIAAADLCLAGHFNAGIEKANRTIPGKAFIYEAMGKCMILGDSAANRELFREDDRHHFVTMGDPKSLSDAIMNCYGTHRSKCFEKEKET